jgi:hypothetical protein
MSCLDGAPLSSRLCENVGGLKIASGIARILAGFAISRQNPFLTSLELRGPP